MREIKFRAWDVKGEKMQSVFRIDMNPETGWPHTIICGVAIDGCAATQSLWNASPGVFEPDFVLMQYTGLKDKNGKDLDWWEGDLLRLGNGDDGTWPIVWDDNGACFMCGDDLLVNVILDNRPFEKVGNIHSNPELLK